MAIIIQARFRPNRGLTVFRAGALLIAADPNKAPVLPLNNSCGGKNWSGFGKVTFLSWWGEVSEGDEKESQKPVTLL